MNARPTTVALLLAAGSGERLEAGIPKAFVELQGKTLLQWSAQALSASPSIDQIVVALPEGARAPDGLVGVRGGATRSQSVALALAAAAPSSLVLVHDAARPLVTVTLIEAVLQAVQGQGVDAAIAAIPLTDTVKQAAPPSVIGSPSQGLPVVARTLPREQLWAVQTPQAFKRPALERVLAQPAEVLAQATDDASLIERAGGTVVLVPSSARNLKITTPTDLRLGSALLGSPQRD